VGLKERQLRRLVPIYPLILATMATLFIVAPTTTAVYAQNITTPQPPSSTTTNTQIIDRIKNECAASFNLSTELAEIGAVLAESCLSLIHESARTIVLSGDLLITQGAGLFADNLYI
jgi:hypothetical protein